MSIFLFLLLGVFLGVHPCPDRWALSQIDAWTLHTMTSRGHHHRSINIYDLDNNEMIEVSKANVSVLCDGMIKNFRKLRFLSLVDANITKIQDGAFQNLPALVHLSLAVNHLVEVQKGQFQNLGSLEVLYLSKNQIERVDRDAFYHLHNLKRIYLDRNRLYEIESDWFGKNPKISVIDLSLNKLTKLQKGAFSLPPDSIVEIRLQNNEIEEVEAEAVVSEAGDEEIPYLVLHLDHNNLTGIPKEFIMSMDEFQSTLFFDSNQIRCFEPESLRVLKTVSLKVYANDNPLSCDCLEAATNFVKDNEIKATFNYSSSLDCQLTGLKVDSWSQPNYFD